MHTEFSIVGVVFHRDSVQRVEHGSGKSILHCEDGTSISANLVLDATGHARKLVEFDRPFKPGYQATFRSLYAARPKLPRVAISGSALRLPRLSAQGWQAS